MVQYDKSEFFNPDQESAGEESLQAQAEQTGAEGLLGRTLEFLQKVASGDILADREVARGHTYQLLLLLAVSFGINITCILWSVNLDIEYNKLTRELAIVRDNSVIVKDQLFRKSSHDATMRRLRERGTEMVDPAAPPLSLTAAAPHPAAPAVTETEAEPQP